MSPASKSKSKDKRAGSKSSTKPTSNASGYNPLLGTFNALDTTEDHNGNSVTGVEYDSLSNNGSWSGESEDHKDKSCQLSTVDNDKREKIRQKNEKKHQRQKEKRAQELHERCSGYLMSRKLESLAQQLVAMGFSLERATMALILNEGRVEQSVAWLFEGGDDSNNHQEHNNIHGGGNLKIDISEELAQITEMEIKFKCSKQEVERAVVACEGDLDQAAETLKVQKQELPPAAPPKLDETSDFSNIVNGKLSMTSTPISKAIPLNQKLDDKDLNYHYAKSTVTVGPTSTDPGIKTVQLLKKVPPPSVERRWPTAVGGSNPNLNPPLQVAPPAAKTEPRYASVGTELKNIQLGSVREPVIMMQRPKLKSSTSSVSPSSSSSAYVSDWQPSAVEPVMNMNSNGLTTTRSFNGSYDQFHYQQPLPQQHYPSSSGSFDHFSQPGSMNYFNNGGMWNRMVGTSTAPTLAAASSLGLFSGLGSNGSPSPVDWNACDSLQFDYTNIDWSLDRIHLPPSSPSNMWTGSVRGNGKTATRPPVGGDNRLGAVGSEASAGGSREWTSAFEEKELFSFPRQFVSSPSL